MRLGIVTSSYPSSPRDSRNAGVFIRDFAELIAARGHEVVVISPQRVVTADEPFDVVRIRWPGKEASLSHIEPSRWGSLVRLSGLLLSGMATCVWVARRRRLDHVLAMWAVPSGLLALAARILARTPYSVWALGSDIWTIRSYPFGRFLLRRVLRGAVNLYADGLRLAEDVTAISGRACEFLPTSRRMPDVEMTAPAEVEHRFTNILCVARWHPHKGVDLLLDALGALPTRVRSRVRVRIFGGGPDELLIRSRVTDELPDVVTVGGFIERTELMAELLAADVLIIPSRIESIPLIMTDAAQARCPVVVTDVGDMGRLVSAYGVGQVVAPEKPVAIAEAITRVVDGESAYDQEGAARMVAELDLVRSADAFLGSLVAAR